MTRGISQALGLLPADVPDGEHPDTRPCPSWCWIVRNEDYDGHEIDLDHVGAAAHTLDQRPVVRSLLYPAMA